MREAFKAGFEDGWFAAKRDFRAVVMMATAPMELAGGELAKLREAILFAMHEYGLGDAAADAAWGARLICEKEE